MLAHVLTVSRLVFALAFCLVLAGSDRDASPGTLLAVTLLLIALFEELTDILDGMAARHYGTASDLGGILDPLADSLSRLAIYFALALSGYVTLALPLVMTARDIIVAYSRIIQASTAGKTGARISGKIKAVVQGLGIPLFVILAWLPEHVNLANPGKYRTALAVIIMAVTIFSMLDYLRGTVRGVREMHRK